MQSALLAYFHLRLNNDRHIDTTTPGASNVFYSLKIEHGCMDSSFMKTGLKRHAYHGMVYLREVWHPLKYLKHQGYSAAVLLVWFR